MKPARNSVFAEIASAASWIIKIIAIMVATVIAFSSLSAGQTAAVGSPLLITVSAHGGYGFVNMSR